MSNGEECDARCSFESSGSWEFQSTDHWCKASITLNEMRASGFLCDVSLVAHEVVNNCEAESTNESAVRKIDAHRIVLSSCCPYFFAMFNSSMSETLDRQVQIHSVCAEVLQRLVDFMYTGRITITEENVEALLEATDLFYMSELRSACCDFMKHHVNTFNCLGVKSFAERHHCDDLAKFAKSYAEKNFTKIIETDEFREQSVESIRELLSSDFLRVPSEELVFDALVGWIRHDLVNRQQYVGKLFKEVRLSYVPPLYLFDNVVKESLVVENIDCTNHVIRSLRNVYLGEEAAPSGHAKVERPRASFRSPSEKTCGLIVVGGQAPKAIKNVDYLNFDTSLWTSLKELPMRRCRCGVVCLDGFVYTVGGFNGSTRVRNVDVFNMCTNSWSSIASLEARRSTLGVGQLGGRIYAVGGFDGSIGLSSAEAYDPRMKDWHYICSMSTKRSSVGVAVMNDLLFAVGGYDGDSHQCLQTVECYEARMDKWINVMEMSCRRSGPAVVVNNNILYVLGGHDGPEVHNSVEAFDLTYNRWSLMPNMISCRRNAGVCSLENAVLAIGGDDGYSNLESVEKLVVGNDAWETFLPSMPISRSYAGVCLVEKGIN